MLAMRAAAKGERTWSDALLVRPWLLVATVALFLALPVLVLGQASENDTRERLTAAQLESAARAAEAVSTSFTGRTTQIEETLGALALEPDPAFSPLGSAVQRGDLATMQALSDFVQRLYPRNLLRAYIAVRGQASTFADATIVVASPAGTGLVGRRPNDPAVAGGIDIFGIEGRYPGSGVSEAYPGSPEAPSRMLLSASVAGTDAGNPARFTRFASARIQAELDLARTFAEVAAAVLASGDDAYLLSGSRELLGRSRGLPPFPLRDLSGDPFLKLLVSGPIVRAGAVDPLGGGTRLIATARVQRSDWQILLLRDTSAVDRELDTVVGQLAIARYVLVALLLVGAVVFARAASVQVRQRRALVEANERVEAASLHKSAFLSSMSHELRTPLNSINGFSDVLLSGMGGTLTDKQREYLADIRGSGGHLLGLVNELLDLSRVEAGKMELHPTEFDIRETVAVVHRVVAPLAAQKGQRLLLDDGDGGTVRLDEARLRQALLNVISNAVKYTPEGGAVTTSLTRRDGTFRIAVQDTGVGVAAEDQSRIFDDFARVDAGYARTQQGTGLGLALARRLVRLMGGDITLVSVPGQGSTFTISVPAG